MSKKDNFQTLVKGNEQIAHAILDSIENKRNDKETENQKKDHMDSLLGIFHWFLDNNVVVPKRLAKFVCDSINNGTITHTVKYPRGYNSNAGFENAMTCLEIFSLVLGGLNKNQAIEKYAKEHNKTATSIHKAMLRHGELAADMIPLVWDTPLTPSENTLIYNTLVHAMGQKNIPNLDIPQPKEKNDWSDKEYFSRNKTKEKESKAWSNRARKGPYMWANESIEERKIEELKKKWLK